MSMGISWGSVRHFPSVSAQPHLTDTSSYDWCISPLCEGRPSLGMKKSGIGWVVGDSNHHHNLTHSCNISATANTTSNVYILASTELQASECCLAPRVNNYVNNCESHVHTDIKSRASKQVSTIPTTSSRSLVRDFSLTEPTPTGLRGCFHASL